MAQVMPDAKKQLEALLRGTVEVHSREELEKKLQSGRPLRAKLGIDPSAPDIHLGHTVVLRKLRQFQDLGHQAVLIVGDFTARVGDPTGRSKTRPQLTGEEVEANARTYLEQVGRVLDMERAEIVRNSRWLSPVTLLDLIGLASGMTVNQFLQRDDFRKRYDEGVPIGLHEFLYLLMQAYDSVMVKADVELGGTDQTFNLMVGRDLMRLKGMEPQVALTMPILPGLDGVQKMSKSLDNCIGVTEEVYEMYSRVLSVPDALMKEWFLLLTALPEEEITRLCDATLTHPKEAKTRLAREISGGYHPAEAVQGAAEKWESLFSRREAPEDAPVLQMEAPETPMLDVLMATGIPSSRSDARRLIQQGGVELDGDRIRDPFHAVTVGEPRMLRVGKKKRYFTIRGG